MSLPVASFNFGAPAERLETYQKGLVLDSMDPATVLDDLYFISLQVLSCKLRFLCLRYTYLPVQHSTTYPKCGCFFSHFGDCIPNGGFIWRLQMN